MELSSVVPAPPPPPLPPQLSPSFQPPIPPQIQPPAATPVSTPPVPGGDRPIGLPRDTTVPLLPQTTPTTSQPPAPQQTASIQTDLVRDPTGRNNPGNIRIPGATGPAGFQTYPTMQAGVQALQNNLLTYQDQYGLNTIQGIITRWSPPNENNTEELIQKASASMGIDRNQRIDLHDPATMTRMTNVILSQEQSGTGGSGPGGMKLPQPQQRMLTPERRDAVDWGHPPPVSGQMPGAPVPESEWARVLNTVSPLLLAIGSIALRLPLSSAITAYGAMSRAQYNGQQEAYERSRTQFQDKLKESTAQQTLESREASDAFDTFGQNNPQGLQQRLMQIALTYNDPALYTTAAKGDLNGAYKLQADRDLHNQSLTKVNDAVRKQQEQEAIDADVAARDRKWRAENPNATADEFAIAHNQHIGEANRAGSKDPKASEEKPTQEKTQLELEGAKARTREWAQTQNPPVDPNSDAYKAHLAEEVQKATEAKPAAEGPKASDYKDYTWDDPEGKHHGPSSAAMVPGKGLVDPNSNPIPAKPETIRTVSSATSTPAESYPHEAGTGDYTDKPNAPPPGTDISEGEWRQALTYVNTGKAPTFARDKQAMARFREIIPVAMRAMGITEEQMDRRWIDYAAYKTRQQRIEAAFAGGQDGKTLLALNTVAHHIDLFRQYAQAMRNGDTPAMNAVIDNLARQGGAAELVDFKVVSRVTGDELVRVLTGTGGGTITDREDIAHQLSSYSSPEQFEGVANTLTNVLRGRFGPLQRAYAWGDPAKEKFFQENMMEPEARRMFQGEQLPIPGASGGGTQPRQWPAPPDAAIQQLKSDPGSRAHFDEVFGPGAAARVLGQ